MPPFESRQLDVFAALLDRVEERLEARIDEQADRAITAVCKAIFAPPLKERA